MATIAEITARRKRERDKNKKAPAAPTAGTGTSDPKKEEIVKGANPEGANPEGEKKDDKGAVQFKPIEKGPSDSAVPDPVNTEKRESNITSDGPTKKQEEKDEAFQKQKELQDQSHKNQLELQQNSQKFQAEQADKADQNWYARQNYLRAMKSRNTKWTFKATQNGGSMRSRWTIQTGNGAAPQNDGRIGIAPRGPDGKSSLRMNGPSIQPTRPIGAPIKDRTSSNVQPAQPGQVQIAQTKASPVPTTPKDIEAVASAVANGGTASITRDAVNAAGKKMKITSSATGGQWLAIGGTDAAGAVGSTLEEAMTNQRNKTVAALEASDQQKRDTLRQHAGDKVSALLASDDPELRKLGQDYAVKQDARITAARGRAEGAAAQMDSAIKAVKGFSDMMARNQAQASKPFSVGDFTQRKQRRDGSYYDA